MTKRLLVTAEIAHELQCSPRTVRRLYAEGKLKGAFKLGGTTSPIKMTPDAVDRIKREGGKNDEIS